MAAAKKILQKLADSVWPNFADPNLCPVNWLMASLASMPVGTKYLFPKVVNGSVDNNVTMSPDDESQRWKNLCVFADLTITCANGTVLAKYTTHSTRHTFAWWAKLCGAQNMVIKVAGRWMSFSAFMTYIKLGLNDAAHAEMDEQRAAQLNQTAIASARSRVMEQWKWQDPLPQTFFILNDGSNVIASRVTINPGLSSFRLYFRPA
jgi:integrase